MINLIGKKITKVDFVKYCEKACECETAPDYCDELTVEFSDGQKLRLVGESSQDMGYIEIILSK